MLALAKLWRNPTSFIDWESGREDAHPEVRMAGGRDQEGLLIDD
jgi:hypothetical protein